MVDFVEVANKLMLMVMSHRSNGGYIFVQLIQRHLRVLLAKQEDICQHLDYVEKQVL